MSPTGPARTWVKICGITNEADAIESIRAGADALGFNLWSRSKRFIPIETEASWIADLSGEAERIAVLVNAPIEDALGIADHGAFDAVQFHGTEDEAYLREFSKSACPFIIARPLTDGIIQSVGQALSLTDRFLVDAAVPGEFGGTGVLADLDLASALVNSAKSIRVILAGGLTPNNVAAAIHRVRPFGVDVASGVELGPRRKDYAKVRRFISEVREGGLAGSQ